MLAKRLGVGHRQAVNQAARRLEAQGRSGGLPGLTGRVNALPDSPAQQTSEPTIRGWCPAAVTAAGSPRTKSRKLRQFGTPLVDLVGPTLYTDHQSGIDDTVPHGWNYYWKATNLTGLSDEVIDVVAEHAYRVRSPRSYAATFHLGGAVARVPRDATAYPARDVAHNMSIDAAWLADEDETSARRSAWRPDRSPPVPSTAPASSVARPSLEQQHVPAGSLR